MTFARTSISFVDRDVELTFFLEIPVLFILISHIALTYSIIYWRKTTW
jgi:hypothetical protein